LAPFVGIATTGFCHLGEILHHEQLHLKIWEFIGSNFIRRMAELFRARSEIKRTTTKLFATDGEIASVSRVRSTSGLFPSKVKDQFPLLTNTIVCGKKKKRESAACKGISRDCF
jgi:hypothetical protein